MFFTMSYNLQSNCIILINDFISKMILAMSFKFKLNKVLQKIRSQDNFSIKTYIHASHEVALRTDDFFVWRRLVILFKNSSATEQILKAFVDFGIASLSFTSYEFINTSLLIALQTFSHKYRSGLIAKTNIISNTICVITSFSNQSSTSKS